jgi:hypothetical protein
MKMVPSAPHPAASLFVFWICFCGNSSIIQNSLPRLESGAGPFECLGQSRMSREEYPIKQDVKYGKKVIRALDD